jgi:hypothetical protein
MNLPNSFGVVAGVYVIKRFREFKRAVVVCPCRPHTGGFPVSAAMVRVLVGRSLYVFLCRFQLNLRVSFTLLPRL